MYTAEGIDNPLIIANLEYNRAVAPVIGKPGSGILTDSVHVYYREGSEGLPAGVTIWARNSFHLPEGTFDTIFIGDADGEKRLIEARLADGQSTTITEAASRITALHGVLRVFHSENRARKQAII